MPLTEIQKIRYQNMTQEQLDDKLINCCSKGQLEKAQYLLRSDDLKIHANIHAQKDAAFLRAYINAHNKIINYFIFDLNIEKTLEIEEIIKKDKLVNKMFESRNLMNTLSERLNIPKVKVKIGEDPSSIKVTNKKINKLFLKCCENNDVEYLEQLSVELKNQNIAVDKDSAFLVACTNDSFDVVQYFLIKEDLQLSEHIKDALKQILPRRPHLEKIIMASNLSKQLQQKPSSAKKLKV